MSRGSEGGGHGTEPILPGATLGVLGSGQLGRMLAFEARRMGYRLHTFSPRPQGTPTGQVADREVVAAYDDLEAVRDFASRVDVVTFEFENVAAAATGAAAELVPVRPAGRVLHTTQNRLREKGFLSDHGIPVTPFQEVRSPGELEEALREIGLPAVLKTAGWGYDGKGQSLLERPGDVERAWRQAGLEASDAEDGEDRAGIVEGFVDFELEVSVVGARGLDGSFAHFGVMANDHADHVLDVTVAPAPVPETVAERAVELAREILEALEVVGVMCVEMFWAPEDRLLVNELAPRPHNSGHLTLDACVTSQFEQQLRAACGLPLGSTERLRPAAMANLLGDLWEGGEPPWEKVLAEPGAHLHLYGKGEARPGRKMGHLTVLADTPQEARERVLAARQVLTPRRP